jgi:VWFA-related protein
MSRALALATTVLLGASSFSSAQEATPTFRTEVRRVYVDTFVTRENRPVAGLGAEDFVVLDNGLVQSNVTLLRGIDHPLSAVLLLDASASVRGDVLLRLQDAARELIEHLGEDDEVSLMTFGTRYLRIQALTREHDLALDAVDRIRGHGGTSLLDALFAATVYAEEGRGRPLVVLFTDGDDNASWLSTERLVTAARRSEAVLFAVRASSGAGIAFGSTDSGAAFFAESGADEAGRRMLDAVTAATGGRVLSLSSTSSLAAAFREILETMRSRYLLVLEPTDRTRGWHRLEVRLKPGRKGEVRAREGYVAEGEPPL